MKTGIEWQVSNRELSQKLKELGVVKPGLFYWCYYDVGGYTLHYVGDSYDKNVRERFSAYTVSELGEMLPEYFLHKGHRYQPKQQQAGCRRYYSYEYDEFNLFIQNAKTEADARAKMLIYLLENKLITI